jgi:hypothetical protein
MPSRSRTIRIDVRTHDRLRELAVWANESRAATMANAVREYHEKRFWEESNAGYAALRANPESWAEYQAEMRLWDTTLMDGLEEFPYEGIDDLDQQETK